MFFWFLATPPAGVFSDGLLRAEAFSILTDRHCGWGTPAGDCHEMQAWKDVPSATGSKRFLELQFDSRREKPTAADVNAVAAGKKGLAD